jgi:hypothetical protein
MDEFCKLFELSNRPDYHKICPDIYNRGMFLLDGKNNLTQKNKEYILYKLINIYPNDTTLYYRMGNLFSNDSLEKKILWYRFSHLKDPTNSEYLYTLCKLLYENNEHRQVIELNVNQGIESCSKHIPLLEIFVKSKTKEMYYQDCLKYVKKIIDAYAQKPAMSRDEKVQKFTNYRQLAQLYFLDGKIEKAMSATHKSYELSVKFQLPYAMQATTYQQYIGLHDYTYYDHKTHFECLSKINSTIKHTPLFSFPSRKSSSKIRIGYISNEFNCGPVSNFIYPILQHHNQDKFEIFLFPNEPSIPDRYKEITKNYYPIFGGPDKEVAAFIRQHQIDILVDLMGYTSNNRAEVFAYQPAPIQITYLGYPNTTGLDCMNYRITDSIADHIESNQYYSETLLRMPKCFLLYTPPIPTLYPSRKPTKNTIILGSLNKEPKNTPYVLETWKTILRECPNTQLMIKLESFDGEKERGEYYAKHLGVDINRLILIHRADDRSYFELFSKIDILLDTFPYSGTTTTCHALYNSVPVVTLYHKDYHSHNVSASLLINSGLKELVAYSKDEYVEIVKNLVNSSQNIDAYKRNIKEKFMQSMDPHVFMESYEKLLQDAHESFYTK